MKKRVAYSGILNQSRLQFRSTADLERYYEEKYRNGGYESGCVRFGINVSEWYHAERHRSAMRFLNPKKGERILDAGCGSGQLAAEIAARGAEVEAVDIAGSAFDARYASIANLHFRKMDIEHLAFADKLFDGVVTVETLEHVLNPVGALHEFHRVLKPTGRLILTYPTVNRTVVQEVQRRVGFGRWLKISEHLTEWNFDELVGYARSVGFRLVESEGLVFDFGVFGALKLIAKPFAVGMTKLSLAVRTFPRNSSFVSLLFEKAGENAQLDHALRR